MDLYTIRNKILAGNSIQDIPLRVTFYARVSTDKDEQLNSLSNQIEYFKEYITGIEKWEFVEGYIDEGISGTSTNKRDSFLQMLIDAKSDKFDLILTKEISRFSRSTIDSIKYTQELLNHDVAVYFLNDNINTVLPDSELRLTIMASIAQEEVRKLSERVQFGMRRSINKGVVLGSSNIYGYLKDEGKLIIDESQVEMIRYIFDEYASTKSSLSYISRELEKMGYTTSSGKRIDTTILTRIIKNPKYKGYYCGHKSKIVDYRSKKKIRLDQKEWIFYKDHDSVPPIVSEEIWEKANKRLKKRQRSYLNPTENNTVFTSRYTYSGKVYCGHHHQTYHRSGSGKRKNNPVLECQVYRRDGLKGCTNPRIFEQELDDLFIKIMKQIMETKNTIIKMLLDDYKEFLEKNNTTEEINKLRKKSKELNIKKEKLLDLVMGEYISREEFLIKNEKFNNDCEIINTQIENLELKSKENDNVTSEITYLSEKISKWNEDEECLSELIDSIIDKIIVYEVKEESDKKNTPQKIRLDIVFKTGEEIKVFSDSLGKRYHFPDPHTASDGSVSGN